MLNLASSPASATQRKPCTRCQSVMRPGTDDDQPYGPIWKCLACGHEEPRAEPSTAPERAVTVLQPAAASTPARAAETGAWLRGMVAEIEHCCKVVEQAEQARMYANRLVAMLRAGGFEGMAPALPWERAKRAPRDAEARAPRAPHDYGVCATCGRTFDRPGQWLIDGPGRHICRGQSACRARAEAAP